MSTTPEIAPIVVARFRAALDWMLTHPDWEPTLAASLRELSLPGQRQGISLRAALLALPLEKKHQLAKHALGSDLPAPRHRDALKLARAWGLTQVALRSDYSRPSRTQWSALVASVQTRLSARYQAYKNAQSSLFEQHAALVKPAALKHCTRPDLREDAIQEANLALLEAIDHLQPGENFPPYARQWIARRVRNLCLRERLPISAPINAVSASIRRRPEANPTLVRALENGIVRLDDSPQELLAAPSETQTNAETEDRAAHLHRALATLTPKQRDVIQRRYGLTHASAATSLAHIAQEIGISRQQVLQREKRALAALSKTLAHLA